MIEPVDLALKFIENHPADAAAILETLPPWKTSEFLLKANESATVKTFRNLAADYAALCIPLLPMDKRLYVFKQLDTQGCVDVFRYLNSKDKYRLLAKLPLRKRLAIQTLNKYNQNSVGAWMRSDYISVKEDKTIENAIELIQGSELPTQDYVFVVNSKRQFVSLVNTSQLLKASLTTRISALRNTSEFNLSARATIQEVAQHDAWKHFTMLPVVEHDMRLVGILSYNDLTTALDRSHIEFTANTASIGDDAFNLFWSFFNNFIQLLNDFYSIINRKN
jgi:magnesium transporter